MKKLLFLILLSIFLMSGTSSAITLYDLTGISGTENHTDSKAESGVLIDTDGVADDAQAFLMFEFAGYANSFGLYEFTDYDGVIELGEKLEVFNSSWVGSTVPGMPSALTIKIEFDLVEGIATNLYSTDSALIDKTFGFYITTPYSTFYSHTALNPDGMDHMMIFDTREDSNPYLYGADMIIAAEDIYNLGDYDYDDMIIGVRDVSVPEPATMFLLGSGLIGLAGLSRKRFFI